MAENLPTLEKYPGGQGVDPMCAPRAKSADNQTLLKAAEAQGRASVTTDFHCAAVQDPAKISVYSCTDVWKKKIELTIWETYLTLLPVPTHHGYKLQLIWQWQTLEPRGILCYKEHQ